MNREDIIRMAREAGIANSWDLNWQDKIIERFAALVASVERERLTDAAMKAAEKAVDVAIALEREACADIADQWAIGYPHPSEVIADWIRKRGQA